MSTESIERAVHSAKEASYVLGAAPTPAKNVALSTLARRLREARATIQAENLKDVAAAHTAGKGGAFLDRLVIGDKTVEGMARACEEIAALPDPVGEVVEGRRLPNGLDLMKRRVALGVVGIIYESRPNVTIDAAALCLKAGNACVLRGGSESVRSNIVLGRLVAESLTDAGLPSQGVVVIDTPDRAAIGELLKMDRYIDLIIPRGGTELIRYVTENSTIPVVKHDRGLCHLYVHEDGDPDIALAVAINAKTQRPGVCNAVESLLIHENYPAADALLDALEKAGVELRVDGAIAERRPGAKRAIDADYDTEFLDFILAVKTVASVGDAILHIRRHGSLHSEAIITRDDRTARIFETEVDAAAVFVNCSTRFNDGGELGLGAEIGISSGKLHCRGPMGLRDLTTTKYIIRGAGQVRA